MAYYNKAETILRMGDASVAIGFFDRALRIEPHYFKPSEEREMLWCKQGRVMLRFHYTKRR